MRKVAIVAQNLESNATLTRNNRIRKCVKKVACIVLLAVSLLSPLWASCSGDCKSCHFNLDYKKDMRHKPMLACKSCHTDKAGNNAGAGVGCGQDCFVCHSVEKIRLPELRANHKVIDECINCHKGLSQPITPNVKQSGGQNIFEQSLKHYSEILAPKP